MSFFTEAESSIRMLFDTNNAGFHVDPKRVIVETVSGSVPAKKRREFARLIVTYFDHRLVGRVAKKR